MYGDLFDLLYWCVYGDVGVVWVCAVTESGWYDLFCWVGVDCFCCVNYSGY